MSPRIPGLVISQENLPTLNLIYLGSYYRSLPAPTNLLIRTRWMTDYQLSAFVDDFPLSYCRITFLPRCSGLCELLWKDLIPNLGHIVGKSWPGFESGFKGTKRGKMLPRFHVSRGVRIYKNLQSAQ